jgi:hypothetical protein
MLRTLRETLAGSSGILGLAKDAHVFRLTLFASTGWYHPISIPAEYTIDLLIHQTSSYAAITKAVVEVASGDMIADVVSHSCSAELSDDAFQTDFKANLRMRKQPRYRGDTAFCSRQDGCPLRF